MASQTITAAEQATAALSVAPGDGVTYTIAVGGGDTMTATVVFETSDRHNANYRTVATYTTVQSSVAWRNESKHTRYVRLRATVHSGDDVIATVTDANQVVTSARLVDGIIEDPRTGTDLLTISEGGINITQNNAYAHLGRASAATEKTITTAGTYQLMDASGTLHFAKNFTEGSGVLTYSGTPTRKFHYAFNGQFSVDDPAMIELMSIGLMKNSTIQSATVVTAKTDGVYTASFFQATEVTGTTTIPSTRFHRLPFDARILSCYLIDANATGIVADNSNFANVGLLAQTPGGSEDTVALYTSVVSQGSWSAEGTKLVPITGTVTRAAGDMLILNVSKTGAGVTYPISTMIVNYVPTHTDDKIYQGYFSGAGILSLDSGQSVRLAWTSTNNGAQATPEYYNLTVFSLD